MANPLTWIKQQLQRFTGEVPPELMLYPGTAIDFGHTGLPTQGNYSDFVRFDKELISSCIDLRAEAVAKQKLRLFAVVRTGQKLLFPNIVVGKQLSDFLFEDKQVYRKQALGRDENIVEIFEHPFLDLMNNVNNFMNEFTLWETTTRFLDLTGNSYWYVRLDQMGIPSELWVLPAQSMRIVPDKKDFIKGYWYMQQAQLFGLNPQDFDRQFMDIGSGKRFFLEEQDIIHFKIPSSRSDYYGRGYVDKLSSSINVMHFMNEYDQHVFKNMGSLSLIFSTEQKLTKAQHKLMKTELREEYQGIKNAGKIAVLSGGLKTAGQNVFKPKEMVQPYVLRALRQQVLFAFKIPESLMDKDANRNAAEVADFSFMKNAVHPLLRRYEQKINEKLLPLYDNRLFAKFDNPIPEDRSFRLRELETTLRTGYHTINELRERDGLSPVPWGEEPFDVRQLFQYLEGGQDVPTDRSSEEE